MVIVVIMQFKGLLAHVVTAVQMLAQRVLAAEDLREGACCSNNEVVHHLALATEIARGDEVMLCADATDLHTDLERGPLHYVLRAKWNTYKADLKTLMITNACCCAHRCME